MATATFPVFNDNNPTYDEFRAQLAAYCNNYVMEVAKPIMESCEDLFTDAAIVKLVSLWFAADRQYSHKRQNYLVQWSQYNPDDANSFQPSSSYEWDDKERLAYRTALDSLLVR